MPPRLAFLDVFRGFALIVMVLNHTSRWWIAREMGWWRYWLVYGTVTVAAPIFLFLVGFVLPLSLHRHAGDIATPSRLWTYFRRGATIVAAGLLLNVIVFGSINLKSLSPEDSPLAGGVLQTIGLSIIVMTPTAALLRFRWGRPVLLGVAVGAYLLFLAVRPSLQAWLPQHPLIALTLFLDYAPWPWMSIVLIGLVVGWWWRDVAARGPDAPFFRTLAVVGVVFMALAVLAELRWPSTPHIGFARDAGVNNHWIPASITAVWILGMLFVMLALFYWLCEVRGWRPGWLVVLGQTALMIYFVHQVIVFTLLGERGLHVTFHAWWKFWGANAALIVACVGMGYAWQAIKARSKGWFF
jgi:surface polysaccharide O-acyltransferase-like enzyme